MNKKQTAAVTATALYCLSFGNSSIAEDKLATLNQQVELKAAEIDAKHGVLLDSIERQELKLNLIVEQVASQMRDGQTVKTLADDAITTYAIEDPSAQRELLIKLEARVNKSTGHGGPEPTYP